MFRCAKLALFSLALVALPVAAEEVSVSEPLAAASLREGPLDMVAYYVPAEAGALEVIATFAAPVSYAEPMRIAMLLEDGDAVTFALPGFRGSNYIFARRGKAVTIAVVPLTRTALAD